MYFNWLNAVSVSVCNRDCEWNSCITGIPYIQCLLFRVAKEQEVEERKREKKNRINSIENTLVGKPPVGIEFKIFIVHSNFNMLLQKITEYKAQRLGRDRIIKPIKWYYTFSFILLPFMLVHSLARSPVLFVYRLSCTVRLAHGIQLEIKTKTKNSYSTHAIARNITTAHDNSLKNTRYTFIHFLFVLVFVS